MIINLAIALVALVVLCVLFASMYVKANPQIAFIISGLRKNPRVLIGTGGIKIPILDTSPLSAFKQAVIKATG